MGIDFHFTQQDISYTMPSDDAMVLANMVNNWLDSLKQQSLSCFVVRKKPGTSPGRGVLKQ
jgi:hypothetical protein